MPRILVGVSKLQVICEMPVTATCAMAAPEKYRRQSDEELIMTAFSFAAGAQ